MSLADLIVIAGDAAIEDAAKKGGVPVQIPFTAGRTDASQEQTDVESFAVLEPDADGFRNFIGEGHTAPAEHLLIERAFRLTLTAPEMTALVGGLRVLGANSGQGTHGVFTKQPGALTNDFFVNLLDMGTEWKATSEAADRLRRAAAASRATRGGRPAASTCSSAPTPNSRALAEVYATDDAKAKFVHDFAAAWTKVMNLDRFDLA